MAFRQLADLDCDRTTAIGGKAKDGKPNPKSIEGYFIGTKQVESQLAKSGFASLHILQTQDGNVGVWGKTNLDQKMKVVRPGTMVRVTFTGMQNIPGKRPMYKYGVEVDDENMIEVASAPTSEDSSYSDTDSSGEEVLDDEPTDDTDLDASDEEVEAVDTAPQQRARPPRQAAQVPSAERQRKVQELLRGRRTA